MHQVQTVTSPSHALPVLRWTPEALGEPSAIAWGFPGRVGADQEDQEDCKESPPPGGRLSGSGRGVPGSKKALPAGISASLREPRWCVAFNKGRLCLCVLCVEACTARRPPPRSGHSPWQDPAFLGAPRDFSPCTRGLHSPPSLLWAPTPCRGRERSEGVGTDPGVDLCPSLWL